MSRGVYCVRGSTSEVLPSSGETHESDQMSDRFTEGLEKLRIGAVLMLVVRAAGVLILAALGGLSLLVLTQNTVAPGGIPVLATLGFIIVVEIIVAVVYVLTIFGYLIPPFTRFKEYSLEDFSTPTTLVQVGYGVFSALL
ncbi:MAG: hypothetical protein ACPLSM_02350, partial [Thermosphaera sp.]